MNTGIKGYLTQISGPVVRVKGISNANVGDQVTVGEEKLIGEILESSKEEAVVQVYEDTTGLSPGDEVKGLNRPLSVELGPGLISQTFDGIQRPLKILSEVSGDFISRGSRVNALDREKKWDFEPTVKEGEKVEPLQVIGEVEETELITHKIMIPAGIKGKLVKISDEGQYTVEDEIAKVRTQDDKEISINMFRTWPVRKTRKSGERKIAKVPLVTGQRILDFLFPISKGGVAAIPGGFGTGKTVTQHQLAKWADADIIIYVGCGERGNEMTQVLEEFPKLEDPRSGRPIIERTVLIANTSNMPVTAREASIYTGITMGEYFRDMGYDVAIMADSTSRWAEALREISGRLEEMPAEQGFPPYLSSRIAEFYERAGSFKLNYEKEGSLSIVGAVSPPGGDFSEPVTQHTKRFTRVFWALDKELAGERHFPAINWNESYSGYAGQLSDWWNEQVEEVDNSWTELRQKTMKILQEEARLQRVVKLVGPDALPDAQRLTLEIANIIKTAFLQQNAFSEVDSFCDTKKQIKMISLILYFYNKAKELLKKNVPVLVIVGIDVVDDIMRMKETIPNEEIEKIDDLKKQLDKQIQELASKYM